MMFKVDVYGVRYWVADVSEARDVVHFEVPQGTKEDEISRFAYGLEFPGATDWLNRQVNPGGPMRSVKTVCPGPVVPEGLTNYVLIRLACGRREEESERTQDWLVPHGCSYLMERGETIDRI